MSSKGTAQILSIYDHSTETEVCITLDLTTHPSVTCRSVAFNQIAKFLYPVPHESPYCMLFLKRIHQIHIFYFEAIIWFVPVLRASFHTSKSHSPYALHAMRN